MELIVKGVSIRAACLELGIARSLLLHLMRDMTLSKARKCPLSGMICERTKSPRFRPRTTSRDRPVSSLLTKTTVKPESTRFEPGRNIFPPWNPIPKAKLCDLLPSLSPNEPSHGTLITFNCSFPCEVLGCNARFRCH